MRAWDPATLVRHLDNNVLVRLAVRDHDPDRWHVVHPMELNGRPHRVFQELEKDIVEVGGHVLEVEVEAAVQRDDRRVAVLSRAHELGVLDRRFGHLRGRRELAHQADVPLLLLLPQRQVLPDQHTDADSRHVKAVEEAVDGVGLDEAHAAHVGAQLVGRTGHGEQHGAVARVDPLQKLCKMLLARPRVGRRGRPNLFKGCGIHGTNLLGALELIEHRD
mmetsp:Transcript_28273/g.65637  ORF Transcript_28273/g.65637 Transcript_28273/m.65637 type:complete len:219 (-) Transcript_28273:466-1122(-)